MDRLFTSLSALLLAVSVHASGPNRAFASVTGAASWTDADTAPYGIYELPLSATPQLSVGSLSVVPGNFGAVYADGKYFVINGFAYGDITFVTDYVYDAETWTKITDFSGENYMADDMAWDETDGRIYGHFTHLVTFDSFFGTIDMTTGKITEISRPGVRLSALGSHADGTLYALTSDGALCTVDKLSGELSVIGQTGCRSTYPTSGAVLSRTDTFYYATCSDTETAFYAIDLHTAVAEKLYDMPDGEEIRGLFFTGPSAVDKAPGEIRGLEASFNNGSLSGNCSFSLPETLFDGSQITGDMSWTLSVDKTPVASGTGTAGSVVTAALTVDTPGLYRIEAKASNNAGGGPVASLSLWIGDDIPSAVEGLTLEYDGDGSFLLSWLPSEGAHGGYFVGEDVTYSVTRYPGEHSFAPTSATSFSDIVPLPAEDEYETYYYTVTALYHGRKSSTVISESYTVGSVSPPFREEFDNRWDMGKFTVIDANGDWERWNWASKSVTLATFGESSDDYLVLPPLILTPDWLYSFSVDARAKYSSDTERFEILIGRQAGAQALDQVVMEPVDVRSTDFTTFSADFSVESPGTYFLALHCISAPRQGALTIDNIDVSLRPQSGVIPVSVPPLELEVVSGGILITSSGNLPLLVSDLSGRVCVSGVVSSGSFLPLPPGIYIVNGRKVAVR
ncbi:MAG: fibronectin type III domain-containing protein [Muribaculaceae bacterium]|nr:fibronectin type III domain-containing protein [Muribaculaceae bacterium]